MKKTIIYNLSLLLCATLFFACEKQTTPEPVRVQHPADLSEVLRDDAYFARLRAYKQTDHKLAFGWFGSWSAIEASEQCRLRSAPDSMDIISMWSKWYGLSKEQMEDKAYVQKIKGTKVVFCISAKDMPEEFKTDGQITDEGIAAYAKAWGKDSMDKYEYDGIDIDFETAIDHQGPLNTTPGAFKKFCEELSQYIGPKSGTGRLFLIDGNIDYLDQGIAELCTYAVSQAYNCSGGSNLDGRSSRAQNVGWRADQIIFTENFESLWKNGGVTYTDYDGTQMPSLVGMASYARQKEARGFGSYHMEYEYGHSDMPYKYMRQAIQLANPAPKGDYTKTLVSLNEAGTKDFYLPILPSGINMGQDIEVELTSRMTSPAMAALDLTLTVDNSLIAAYNEYYFTSYQMVDPALVEFSTPLHFEAESQVTAEAAKLNIAASAMAQLPDGDYLIPVRIDFAKNPKFAADENKKILYLTVTKETVKIGMSLNSANSVSEISVRVDGEGHILSGSVSAGVAASLTLATPADVTMTAVIDPAQVEKYNSINGTEYKAVAAADVALTGELKVDAGQTGSSQLTLSMPDLSKLPAAHSMIAVRLDFSGNGDYEIDAKNSVRYFVIHREMIVEATTDNIEQEVTSLAGTPIADRDGWTYSTPGAWASSTRMFDGDISSNDMGWYTGGGAEVTVTVDMTKAYTIVGFRMSPILGSTNYPMKRLYDIMTSEDGATWYKQSTAEYVKIGAYTSGGWQYVKFITPVSCRYIRMLYKSDSASANNNFAGANEFDAIQ